MRSPKTFHSLRALLYSFLVSLVAVGLLLWPSRPLVSENFVIYQPNSRAVLPVQVIDQTKYLPVLPVLNAVGKVGAIQEKRESLKVWFGEREIELQLDDPRVRLGKSRLRLSQPVRKPGTQWLVPVEFLAAVLPSLSRQNVVYVVGENRVFLGDVKPMTFTIRLDPTANGARLTLQFSEKVTTRTAATDGKWYIYLGDRPVQPLEQEWRFQNPYVGQVQFDDQDGVPKVIITPAAAGLNFYPSSAEEGKVLLADIVKPSPVTPAQAPTANQPSPAPSAPSAGTAVSPASEQPAPSAPGPPLPVVVLDPAHGGEDAGARSRDGLLEKDLTAQLAARVRLALLATRKYRLQLTRIGDVSTNFEQRETVANAARPVAYFSFHAGDLGNTTARIAVFSYRGTPWNQAENIPLLVPWDKIYRLHLDQSRKLAQALQDRFAQVSGISVERPMEAPVRSLRSIDAPAVAIEVGSLNADLDSGALTGVGFQQQIATAVAAGLDAFRTGAL